MARVKLWKKIHSERLTRKGRFKEEWPRAAWAHRGQKSLTEECGQLAGTVEKSKMRTEKYLLDLAREICLLRSKTTRNLDHMWRWKPDYRGLKIQNGTSAQGFWGQ